MNTLEQLLRDVPVEGTNVMISRKRGQKIPRVTEGLKSKRPPVREGSHLFQPEELLTILVDEIDTNNGRVVGYQRLLDLRHARRIAKRLREGKPVPTLEVGMDGRNRLYYDDGQHRAAGAVMARVPVMGLIQKRSRAERAELFTSQRNAKKIDQNVLTLAGDSDYERYVQEAAMTKDKDHPWYGFVSPGRHSKTKIAPYMHLRLLIRFVGNTIERSAQLRLVADRWDERLADELAPLIRCFGNKQTNPLAFKTINLLSIGAVATHVFRRHEHDAKEYEQDYERWLSHMSTFPFQLWPHLRSQVQVTDQLIAHWNKGLRRKQRIIR